MSISRNGIPTGGSLCVQVANIAVYFAFRCITYSNIHVSIVYLVRFVDDGTGGWMGPKETFISWVFDVNQQLKQSYGLELTYKVRHHTNFIEFLYITINSMRRVW